MSAIISITEALAAKHNIVSTVEEFTLQSIEARTIAVELSNVIAVDYYYSNLETGESIPVFGVPKARKLHGTYLYWEVITDTLIHVKWDCTLIGVVHMVEGKPVFEAVPYEYRERSGMFDDL